MRSNLRLQLVLSRLDEFAEQVRAGLDQADFATRREMAL